MKIIGNTVGTTLPKSNFKQTDPTKGDYIKNKPEVIDPAVGQLLAIKTIDEDGYITEFESVEVSTDDTLSIAKAYTDSEIAEWVGDKKVATQISEAVSSKANTSDLTSHTGNTTAHITATERTNWNTAKSHADSPHAPSGAQANIIESIKVNGIAQTITSKSVNITVPTDNKDLANGAGYLVAADIANKADKATTLAGYGITDAAEKSHDHDDKYYTESEIDTKFSNLVGDTAVPTQVSTALSSAKSYTDGEISKLLNNSTEAIDSIYELRDAMEDNADAISALESIAGNKANASDLTAHTGNKSNPHGVTLAQLGVTATAEELNIMDGVTATTTELNYVDGVTSNIQTQLNAKVPTSRKVNGKALSADITLSASDVGADASGAAAGALTSAKAYTDAEITEWVGDEKVATQIETAVADKVDKTDIIPIENGGTNAADTVEARQNLGFTYGEVAPTEAPETGEGSVYFMNATSEIPLPIPEGGTGAMNAQGAIENLGMYPIGAQYVTSTNTNPGAWLGGSWELTDKQFADAVFGAECFVSDTTKVSGTPAVSLHRNGHSIAGNFCWTPAVNIADSTIVMGHLNFSILGISQIGYDCVINALSDGGGVVVMTRIASTTGDVYTVDCFGSDTTLVAGKYIYGYMAFTVPKENMLDSACDKFFWKRVA